MHTIRVNSMWMHYLKNSLITYNWSRQVKRLILFNW